MRDPENPEPPLRPMTKNEAAVRAVFPDATIERHKTNGGEVYFLVRETAGAYLYIGSGDTRAQAWAEAARSGAVTAANPAAGAVRDAD